MWGRLSDMAKNAEALDEFEGFAFLFSQPIVKQFVVKLNTSGQLWRGLNAEGESLDEIGGSYTELTKALKAIAGLPTDRVTLFDTGEFYTTFSVIAEDDGFLITADTIKQDSGSSHDLQSRWGESLIGLTEGSRELLIGFILSLYIDWLKQQLLK